MKIRIKQTIPIDSPRILIREVCFSLFMSLNAFIKSFLNMALTLRIFYLFFFSLNLPLLFLTSHLKSPSPSGRGGFNLNTSPVRGYSYRNASILTLRSVFRFSLLFVSESLNRISSCGPPALPAYSENCNNYCRK